MELPRNELPVSEYFDFTTQHKKEADYMGKNANRYHKIFPEGKDSWNFRLLATFINEFELEPGDCRSYNDKTKNYCYFSFYFINDEDIRIIIRIYNDCSINVEASIEFIFAYMDSSMKEIETDTGSQGRKYSYPRKCKMMRFVRHMRMTSPCSSAILKVLPIGFFQKELFSRACRWFLKRITLPSFPLHIKKNFDTSFIYDYEKNWLKRKDREVKVDSLKAFINQTIGFLHLTITQFVEKDDMHTITIDGKSYTIIDGIYISPFVVSLFNNNDELIDGLIMDTTWKVVSKYVTSILMICVRNVGLPIAFTFGAAEDKKLYNNFVEMFNVEFGIDLKKFIVISDQGSALKAICDEFKEHIACLRHFW